MISRLLNIGLYAVFSFSPVPPNAATASEAEPACSLAGTAQLHETLQMVEFLGGGGASNSG